MNIALFELGFTDRVVSMDLSSILRNVPIDRRSIISAIKLDEQRVRNVLNKYPSYFIDRLNSLI